jgi:hypothetical protein
MKILATQKFWAHKIPKKNLSIQGSKKVLSAQQHGGNLIRLSSKKFNQLDQAFLSISSTSTAPQPSCRPQVTRDCLLALTLTLISIWRVILLH